VRVRTLGAAAAAVLALAGLAGCRTNIGTAAVIDGHKVTESDVSHYLTPNAQPVSEQDQTGTSQQISPRSFVVSQLINERLGFAILQAVPAVSNVTPAQIDSQLQSDLAGKTPREVAESLGLHGYTDDFYQIVLRVQEISGVLRQQDSTAVQKAISTIHFPVTVAPRFGRWDGKQLRFSSGATVPGYLDLKSGAPAPLGLPGTS
jgi:hypothetical protein